MFSYHVCFVFFKNGTVILRFCFPFHIIKNLIIYFIFVYIVICGLFQFCLWSLDLFLDDVRIPLVTHGSCANVLVFMV